MDAEGNIYISNYPNTMYNSNYGISNSTEPFSIDRVEDRAEKFEILTLAQSWPQTNCWEINNEWEAAESKCSPCRIRDKTNQWTLHGAWPSNRRRNHPSFCGGMKYRPELLDASLRSELEYKWPTMKSKSSDDAFWTHEWKKHGSCAGEVETMNSVSNYFSESLRLLNQYNVGSILEQSEIVPGKTYELNRIHNAMKIGLRVNPFISCSTNKVSI